MARGLDRPTAHEVIHVIDTLSVGGAQRLLTILATDTAAACPAVVDLRGHSSPMVDDLRRRGVILADAGVRRSLDPRDWFRLWLAMRRLPSKLVHLHLTDSVIMGAPLARLSGRRVVVTVHNSLTVPDTRLSARIKRFLETISLRHFTDHAILVGDNVATANAGRLAGVPQTVLRNVILPPPDRPGRDRNAVRSELGAAGQDVVFISTGRLHKQKDHSTLLAAFAKVRQDAPDTALWILGDGHLRQELEAEAEALHLGQSVKFLGPKADVASYLAAADVFVMSSKWEGLPLGLLEGMAAGLPVVATAVGELPTIFGTSDAILVPPGDVGAFARGMSEMATAPTIRAGYAEQSRKAVAPYLDVRGWLDRTVGIYDEVLGRRARSR